VSDCSPANRERELGLSFSGLTLRTINTQMSGEAGPSVPAPTPPPDVNNLARQISTLSDASLEQLGAQLDPATRKRMLHCLGPNVAPSKGKKPARSLFAKVPEAKTLREQYRLLRDMHKHHHIAWIQDLRGYLIVMSEEIGNISTYTDPKDPYTCWEHPADDRASTVTCLGPKRGPSEVRKVQIRKPEKAPPKSGVGKSEGYVYYQIPSWVKTTCNDKNIVVPFSKMVLHKLVMIAQMVLEDRPVEDVPIDMECSHLCGNPWCWLHLTLETASVNQARGPCFDPALDNHACNNHGSPFYCIRSRAASSLIPGLLVDGKDMREDIELSIARQWWNGRNQVSGKDAVSYYLDVRAVGGKGLTGFQRAANLLLNKAWVGTPLKALLQRRSDALGS
jgi:hypothetical protein